MKKSLLIIKLAATLPVAVLIAFFSLKYSGQCNPKDESDLAAALETKVGQIPDCTLRTSLQDLVRHVSAHKTPEDENGNSAKEVWKIYRDFQRVHCFLAAFEAQHPATVNTEARATVGEAYSNALEKIAWVERKSVKSDELVQIRKIIRLQHDKMMARTP